MPHIKLCVDNYKKILIITIFACVLSYVYEKYVKVPIFESVTKIVPINVSKQGDWY